VTEQDEAAILATTGEDTINASPELRRAGDTLKLMALAELEKGAACLAMGIALLKYGAPDPNALPVVFGRFEHHCAAAGRAFQNYASLALCRGSA
jgi:hypothetical protein